MSNEGHPDLVTLIRAQMDAAVAQLEVRLIDRFASKKDYEEVTTRLGKHEERISSLEQSRAGQMWLSGWQRWFFGGAFAAVSGALIYVLH